MNYNVINTLLPLLGVVVGASMQFLFTYSGEKRKLKEALKIQAYVDFVKGLAGANIAAKLSKQKELHDNYALVADARVRIAIYGSSAVILSLAEFFKQGGEVVTEKGKRNLLNACQAMRADIKNENVDFSEISQLIYSEYV